MGRVKKPGSGRRSPPSIDNIVTFESSFYYSERDEAYNRVKVIYHADLPSCLSMHPIRLNLLPILLDPYHY